MQMRCREITQGTNDYVDGILANIENNMLELGKSLNGVEMTIQNAIETIQNNRKELKQPKKPESKSINIDSDCGFIYIIGK